MLLWRSLRFQLLAGFALIGLLGLVFFAFSARSVALRAFRSYLDESRVQSVAGLMLRHYERSGTWQGVERALPPPPPPLVNDKNAPPRPAAANLSEVPRRGGPPQLIGLLDNENRVVIPVTGQQRGEVVDPAEFPVKRVLELNGEHVGTVLRLTDKLYPGPEGRAFLLTINQTLPWVAGITLVMALALGFALVQSLTRPLRRLTEASETLAAGNLNYRVPEAGNSEFKTLAASFNQMAGRLAQADKQRRQMTADIAHDLRTPLTVISGYVQSLKNGKLAATPERLELIHDELNLLNNLVEDLRLLSLADAGELTLVPEKVRSEDLLRRTYEAFKLRAQRQAVELNVDLTAELPTLTVDPERIRQVLGNLVVNALHHTPTGGAVRLFAVTTKDAVVLRVQDNGAGIPAAKLPHIFERFYRADESRTDEKGSSGLGLAIAKSIVGLHGGEIWAESEEGSGTTLSVQLPYTQPI